MRTLPLLAAVGGIALFVVTETAQAMGGAELAPLPNCLVYDDGLANNAVGFMAGGSVVWMHRQGGLGQITEVFGVQVAYGNPPGPASSPAGTPTTIAVWDDPNDDGNPNDLTLLFSVASTVQSPDSNTFVNTTFAAPVLAIGVYFIGVAITQGPNQFPAAIDTSSGPSAGRAWIVGNPTGTVDLMNLSAAPIPPTDIDVVLPGVWLLRATCAPATGIPYCSGTVADCPCANAGSAGRGCANSSNASGGQLTATGTATIGLDTVTLIASGLPPSSPCLFAQGTATASGVFGDGRQCLSGTVRRLRTRTAVGGVASLGFGIPGDPLISVAGAVTPGTFHYQGFYRDAPSFCTPATFNATNGYTIVWN